MIEYLTLKNVLYFTQGSCIYCLILLILMWWRIRSLEKQCQEQEHKISTQTLIERKRSPQPGPIPSQPGCGSGKSS
jgi:hypothetical protein